MKFYTSYFYQVRFFTPNMIPISTAKWDPKWFHDFQDNKYVFLDKRGVCNGLRADPFVLGEEYCKNLEESHNYQLNLPNTDYCQLILKSILLIL